MSSDSTRFKLSLNGISLEISGERSFVEEMYREIMRDIEEARERLSRGERSGLAPGAQAERLAQSKPRAPALQKPLEHVVWIHRCAPLVHKIYMASPSDLERSKLFGFLAPRRLSTLYMEDALLSRLLPKFDRGQTLWAELTREGRAKIAEASHDSKQRQGKLKPPPMPNLGEKKPGKPRSPGDTERLIKGSSST